MTVINARASAVDATNGATWASTASAIDGTYGTVSATYATWTSSVSDATGYIELGGFDFSSIPSGSTINTFTVNLRHLVNNTTRISNVTFQPFDGSAIGSAFVVTRSTTAATATTTFTVTEAQLKSAAFTIRVGVTHNTSTQSGILSVDYVDVSVDYTAPATTTVKARNATNTAWVTATNVWVRNATNTAWVLGTVRPRGNSSNWV
jgi:hypothetical protein